MRRQLLRALGVKAWEPERATLGRHDSTFSRRRRQRETRPRPCGVRSNPRSSAEQRRVIVLAYFRGLRERQVAERLGVSVARVPGLARLQRSASEGSMQRREHDTRTRHRVRERA